MCNGCVNRTAKIRPFFLPTKQFSEKLSFSVIFAGNSDYIEVFLEGEGQLLAADVA